MYIDIYIMLTSTTNATEKRTQKEIEFADFGVQSLAILYVQCKERSYP